MKRPRHFAPVITPISSRAKPQPARERPHFSDEGLDIMIDLVVGRSVQALRAREAKNKARPE